MSARDNLEPMLGPTIEGLGYELLGIERRRSDGALLLRIYIDSPEGITLSDCERVSGQVGDLLDAEDAIAGAYTLEVSSPGMDRPLFTLEHYRQYLGALVQMRLRGLVGGRRRLTGTLISVDGEVVTILCADGAEDQCIPIPFAMIERTRLVPEPPAKMPGRPPGRRPRK